jgi:hypothetical protein
MKILKPLTLAALITTTFVHADPPIITTYWTNPECASGNCEVRGMKIHVQKHNSRQQAGNFLAAEVETSSPELAKKYAFVQYVQGCIYEMTPDGKTKIGTRDFFGRDGQPFSHKEWEVDSGPDSDPIYNSNSLAGFDNFRGFEVPRNSRYMIKNPITTESYVGWAGKAKNIIDNKLFVADIPTMTSFDISEDAKITARNSSLKFKICLHKIENVPRRMEAPGYEVAGAIKCMEWSSNYLYNFKTRKMVEQSEIQPACL